MMGAESPTVSGGVGWLRLYVAGASPNSARAEVNLKAAIAALADAASLPSVEIIDVFVDPRRAITDAVIVTPTLIASGPFGRATMVGDLTDHTQLSTLLTRVVTPPTER